MVNLESYIGYFARGTVSFFDYFKGKNVCVFLDEPNRCRERAQAVEYEFRESMTSRLEKGYILPGQMEVLYDTSAGLRQIRRLSPCFDDGAGYANERNGGGP